MVLKILGSVEIIILCLMMLCKKINYVKSYQNKKEMLYEAVLQVSKL